MMGRGRVILHSLVGNHPAPATVNRGPDPLASR